MDSNLVFISLENWDEVWRRNQFVCAELIKRHPTIKIIFVGIQRNVWRCFAKRDFHTLFFESSRQLAGIPQIIVLRPLRIGLERYWLGRKLNEYVTLRHIKRVAHRLAINRPLLWINSQSAVHLVGKLDEAAVIYDITDDWTSISQSQQTAELVRQQDAELCRKANAVIVCSKRLMDMKLGMTKSLHLIPNGVELEHYVDSLNDSLPVPSSMTGWSRPIYGYTGSAHPDRLDIELIRELAQRVSGTIVIIGPDMLPANAKACLALPNIIIFGPVPYSDLPQYMRAFDVCIVPHLVSPFTESLNPIKLWDYLAVGKPIVSTPVAGFRDFSQLVNLASNVDEFAAALRTALVEDSKLPAARRAVAASNSWKSRVDDIENVIGEVMAK